MENKYKPDDNVSIEYNKVLYAGKIQWSAPINGQWTHHLLAYPDRLDYIPLRFVIDDNLNIISIAPPII